MNRVILRKQKLLVYMQIPRNSLLELIPTPKMAKNIQLEAVQAEN